MDSRDPIFGRKRKGSDLSSLENAVFSEGEVSEGGLSENFTTPVLPLTKEELHNEKAAVFFAGLTQKTLGKLMPHMKVSEKKQFLQSYAKWRAASGKVTYNYGKGCGMGYIALANHAKCQFYK